jgi:hypothetical protein
MELRKSDKEQLYEWRTYHIKVDILKEADNCSDTKEFEQCWRNIDDDYNKYYSDLGCLPAWVDKSMFGKNSSMGKTEYCKGAVEDVSHKYQKYFKKLMIDYLDFRPRNWVTECQEPCEHTFYTSTLATKIANRTAIK